MTARRPDPQSASGTAARHRRPGRQVVTMLAIATALPELVVIGSDLGLWGSPMWRQAAYRYGAFWTGLLHGGHRYYPGQPEAMFVTYAFLHAGFWHLASNLLVLLGIGPVLAARAGAKGFLAIWFAAVVGGGIGFGLLAGSSGPMVGASGALFGLVGAWHYREWRDRRAKGRSLGPLLQAVGGLAALNLAMWWLLSGLLAWQTHLGGYAGGWAAAAALRRYRARRRRLGPG